MIRICRGNCPLSLQKTGSEFVEGDYKKNDVLLALVEMQHGKCCYCERSLLELPPNEREVEHYIPRSYFKDASGRIQWHLVNRWENLLYACGGCNGKKLSQNPFNETTGEREIIDPSVDIDPEDHIEFTINFPIISYKAKAGSILGDCTINKLKFREREDLYSKHRKMISIIENHFIDIINALIDNDTIKVQQEVKQLERCMSANVPFAAFSRFFIPRRLNKLNDEQLPLLETKYYRTINRVSMNIPKGYELVM